MSEPAVPADKEKYAGEVHWYDLPDDDAALEDEDPTDPPSPRPARRLLNGWRLPRVLATPNFSAGRSRSTPPAS